MSQSYENCSFWPHFSAAKCVDQLAPALSVRHFPRQKRGTCVVRGGDQTAAHFHHQRVRTSKLLGISCVSNADEVMGRGSSRGEGGAVVRYGATGTMRTQTFGAIGVEKHVGICQTRSIRLQHGMMIPPPPLQPQLTNGVRPPTLNSIFGRRKPAKIEQK